MALNLHLLRIFFEVVERGGFSRAAAALYISQSAVSKAVSALERQLDIPLMERGAPSAKSSRGVRLTADGAALLEHARGIFALERAATEDLKARAQLERGQLTIGASTTVAGYWLPPYLASFSKAHPQVELTVRCGNTGAISAALIDCRIDMALVEGAVDDPRIVATHWRDDEMQIVAHPRSAMTGQRKLSVEALNAQRWLVREPGSGTLEATQRLMKAHGLRPGNVVEFASNEGIARAAAAGLGIAMLPARVVREMVLIGEIQALPVPFSRALVRPLYLLQLRQRPPAAATRAFDAILQRPLESAHARLAPRVRRKPA